MSVIPLPSRDAKASRPDMTDPRVTEYRASYAALQTHGGSSGARDRYDKSIVPYLECVAEMTPDEPWFVRRNMMAAHLLDGGLPLGLITRAYNASEAERDWLEEVAVLSQRHMPSSEMAG